MVLNWDLVKILQNVVSYFSLAENWHSTSLQNYVQRVFLAPEDAHSAL